jgi:hypothetical protein
MRLIPALALACLLAACSAAQVSTAVSDANTVCNGYTVAVALDPKLAPSNADVPTAIADACSVAAGHPVSLGTHYGAVMGTPKQ